MRRLSLAGLLLAVWVGLAGCWAEPEPSPKGGTHFRGRLPGVDKPPALSTAAKTTKP